jgi:hypothetical protein
MELVRGRIAVTAAILGAAVLLLGGSMGLAPCADCAQTYPAGGGSLSDVPGLAVKCLDCRLSQHASVLRHRCLTRQSQAGDHLCLAERQPFFGAVNRDTRSNCVKWSMSASSSRIGVVLLI